jgi:hypothetical protein
VPDGDEPNDNFILEDDDPEDEEVEPGDFNEEEQAADEYDLVDFSDDDQDGGEPDPGDTLEDDDAGEEQDIEDLPVCHGPESYQVSGVVDHYPCNFDSDCAGGECVWEPYIIGVLFGYCSGRVEDFEISGIPNGEPCYYNRDCESNMCLWGRGISLLQTRMMICVDPCQPGDSDDGSYACLADPEYNNPDGSPVYRCEPISGAGVLGDPCLTAEHDCEADLVCLHGYCTSQGCDPCPDESTCVEVTNEYGTFELCVPLIAQGTLVNGEFCLHNIYCQSGSCLDAVCL